VEVVGPKAMQAIMCCHRHQQPANNKHETWHMAASVKLSLMKHKIHAWAKLSCIWWNYAVGILPAHYYHVREMPYKMNTTYLYTDKRLGSCPDAEDQHSAC
jgi:hypothetical protein